MMYYIFFSSIRYRSVLRINQYYESQISLVLQKITINIQLTERAVSAWVRALCEPIEQVMSSLIDFFINSLSRGNFTVVVKGDSAYRVIFGKQDFVVSNLFVKSPLIIIIS